MSDDDQTLKYDAGKLRVDLVPWETRIAISLPMTHGIYKYEENSWRIVDPKRYWAAYKRHVLDYERGEHVDGDSGLPTLYLGLCDLAFYVSLTGDFSAETIKQQLDLTVGLGKAAKARQAGITRRLDTSSTLADLSRYSVYGPPVIGDDCD